MKKNYWIYLLLIAVGASAAWAVVEYVNVRPLQATVEKQAEDLADFKQCKEERKKLKEAASARRQAKSIAEYKYDWSITSVDFFSDADKRDHEKRSAALRLVVNVPDSLKDIKGALVHLTRENSSGHTRTKSIVLGEKGVKEWSRFILNAEKIKGKIKLNYLDSFHYYSDESDKEGDYIIPISIN